MVMQCVTVNMLSTGSLYITSTPPGASIYIDGELQTGTTTPATITTLVEGNHDITISMDGFNDYTTTVLVIADTITTVPDVVLIPNEGCIYFTTNPPGASIYIDDILQEGQTTPALICGLSLGPHTYRLVLEGYLDITGSVDLISGQGENISQDLVPTGSLYITSTPPGASIYIDGELQTGTTTPSTIIDIAEGYHDITISMDGFNDYTTTVLVIAGTTTTLPSATLIPNEGCIYFTTNPPGASIYIDDVLQVGQTTPVLICGLSLGPHTYRLGLEGYLDVAGSIDLTLGHGENISQDLVQTGSLYVTSTPSGASILIDDMLQTGKITPDIIIDIPVGFRDIIIRTTGFNDYTTTVLIEAGMTTPITDVVLIPNEGCMYFTTNHHGASIYIDDVLREETTPALICGLSLGIHTYRLVLEGYLDITGNVDLTSGQGENIYQDLAPIVQAGFDEKQRFVTVGLLFGFVSKAIEKWNKMRTEKII